jgi:hypothetical protein
METLALVGSIVSGQGGHMFAVKYLSTPAADAWWPGTIPIAGPLARVRMRRLVNLALIALIVVLSMACNSPAGLRALADRACPTPGDGQRLFQDDKLGVCFLYPATYDLQQPFSEEIILSGPTLDDMQVRAFIKQETDDGRSVGTVADELLASLGMLTPTTPTAAFAVARSTVRVGGAEGVLLDGMPGQVIDRLVLAVKGGRRWELTFVPADKNLSRAYREMDALYRVIVNSIQFTATAGSQ